MTYSVHTTIFRQLGMDLPAAITTKQPNPQTFFSEGERIPLQGMCRWMDLNQRKRVILTLSLTLIPDRVTGSFPKPDTLPSELHPHLEQVSRIELPSPAWQAGTLTVVLYLHFERKTGFEPATLSLEG